MSERGEAVQCRQGFRAEVDTIYAARDSKVEAARSIWMRSADTPEAFEMGYLSDTNLRAVLTVLVARAGGTVEITNEELYDAMMPGGGERFVVSQTATGVRVSIEAAPQERAGSN